MPKRIRRDLEHRENPWPASNPEERLVSDLLPSARNARTHSKGQVRQLVRSIERWGWTMPVLVDEENEIIAGHGRVLAAKELLLRKVPVIVAKGWSEDEKRAYRIADNKLTLNGEWDEDMLQAEIEALEDFDVSLLGFSDNELAELAKIGDDDEANPYTMKVESPVYEPTGEEPEPEELCDTTKSNELVGRIVEAGLPDEVRDFLIRAASRHIRFDYGKIAEFYAHASPEIQELMEDSALVIVDFRKAIESGYVRVCDRLRELAGDAIIERRDEDAEDEEEVDEEFPE